MSNSKLQVSDLDFDSIKANLKNFLRDKPQFKDYDFEGSGLSVLLDVLAYNTHYEAMIANQLVSELTLDTAKNRTIVNLHAKRLGYIPRSFQAARTTINLEVINPTGNPNTLTLGKGANFVSISDSASYSFINREPKTIQRNSDGRYVFENIEIFEGFLKNFRYEFSANLKKFEIPDENVDLDSLRVFVQQSATNIASEEYFKKDRLPDIKEDSRIYFIGVNQRGRYEIYFGDNVLGKSPDNGNVIILEYIVTSGSEANDISIIRFNDVIEGNTNVISTLNSKTYGGKDIESIESIKFNAYKNSLIQDRAVTETDYADLIRSFYPLDSISVWGGERNDPPVYGRVFVAIKPIDAESVLTESAKDSIRNYLRQNKSVITIVPEFVDVDYLYIEPTTVVYVDSRTISQTVEEVKTLVRSAIEQFSDNELERFNKIFRYSKFLSFVDEVSPAIISNVTSLKITKRFVPNLLKVDTWSVKFNNPINQGTFRSSSFRIQANSNDVYLKDSNGTLQVAFIDNSVERILISNAGTIDYATGTVQIQNVVFESFSGSWISLSGSPASPDIISQRNSIVLIDKEKINVSAIIESSNMSEHQFAVIR